MSLEDAFPNLDCGCAPLGGRVIVQLKTVPKKTTASGIILVEETRDTEKANTQVAKVIALGPLAFRKRDSLELWAEGIWAEVGDYVRVPRWGGDAWGVPIDENDPESEVSKFCVFNDFELISKITGDPLKVKAYLL